MSTPAERLAELLVPLGLETPSLLARLEHYAGLIQQYGARLNLVGRLDDDFVRRDLIAGSLQLLRLARPQGRLVDVGSGAGLPGIPLALALPDLEVTLLEPRERRAAFLRRACQLLGLDGVRVDGGRVEAVKARFDWAVARAFKPPGDWLRVAERLLVPGGHAGVYTTRALWAAAALPPRFEIAGLADDPTGAEQLVAVVRLQGSLPSGIPSPS